MEHSIRDIHRRISRRKSTSVNVYHVDAISTQRWLRQSETERQIVIHPPMEFEPPTTGGTELVVRRELPRERGHTSLGTTDSDELFGVLGRSKHRQHHSAKNSDVAESDRGQVLQPHR